MQAWRFAVYVLLRTEQHMRSLTQGKPWCNEKALLHPAAKAWGCLLKSIRARDTRNGR